MHCTVEEFVSVDQLSLRVLVGDDQADVLEAIRLLLKGAGHKTVTVESPAALLKAAESETFDLILMDLNYARDTTSGQEGLDLLTRLHSGPDAPPVVVMTAWGNIELAVEAMRRGACDFIQKPWDNARLLETVRKQSRRRARTEMELARHVQTRLFPQGGLHIAGIDAAATCLPARQVSGDYYGTVDIGEGHCGFLLADVSGKGMAAALLMAHLHASFQSHANLARHSPTALVTQVNELFFDSTLPEHYATLFYGHFDPATRALRYVNCGHLAPVVLRNDGGIERLEPTATVIGLFRAWKGQQGGVRLDPGDLLVLFSDGVTEAGVQSGGEFGEQRLISLLSALRRESVDRILDRTLESVRAFNGSEQDDDLTLMILRAR